MAENEQESFNSRPSRTSENIIVLGLQELVTGAISISNARSVSIYILEVP